MKFLVVQYGARRNYAVPEALERAGVLSAMYTDFLADRGFGRPISLLAKAGVRLDPVTRWAKRRPSDEVLARTTTFDAPALWAEYRLPRVDMETWERARKRIEHQMIAAGTRDATHIFSMLGEGGLFLEHAQQKGLTVICDVYIALSAERLLEEEAARFPDWDDRPMPARSIPVKGARSGRDGFLLDRADLLVCPSDFVAADLVQNYGVDPARVAVIPYAVREGWPGLVNTPQPGRVLFAGTAGLRKGIHYLAEAANILRAQGREYQFRVAGGVSDKVRHHKGASALTFLGRLPRDQMGAEFAAADLFVLPTLAEGSAAVTYEAMHAGLPIVTTPAAGSVARDGLDGRVLHKLNAEKLARAIDTIVQDRDLRNQMGSAAKAQARRFTWDRFAHDVMSLSANSSTTATRSTGV